MSGLDPALVGELVVLLLLLGIVWMVFREFLRVVLKVVVPVAILTALAVWLGYLDETLVGDALSTVGEGLLTAIRYVADWVTSMALPE
ncbi:MAG: hypothetical protein F4087_09785 [Gemmatimonadetes bacterium]|nr:hypothetical protein [Gemmatimonadota bacterium]MDE2677829.1 hypothetical protein [Gemmatimonadota bacterium]MXX36294.1 hypothetical protein [Gemmatimonadota bacterium]MYA12839.1 hypothetical protein [Gemmatimonadota bacterium]MYD14690.1 hypothetical protein [Gemmatimonadota bacterium]